MQKNTPRSTAPTVRRLQKKQNLTLPNLSTEVDEINAASLRVEHSDGLLTNLDVVEITDALEQSALEIGCELDDENQGFIDQLCLQVVQALAHDLSASETIEADDIDVQVEMILMLNQQTELAKAYLQRQTIN
ncbi:MAG: hypothetical protein ACJA2E_001113 [Arenicella sp.]|jgi:hypothetical protein